MGYFKELYDRPVQRPNDDVAIINTNQVSNYPQHLVIKRKNALFSSYNLKIKTNKGKEVFKGKREYNTIKYFGSKYKICNLDKTVSISIKECDMKNVRKNIYIDGKKEKLISKVLYGDSNRKYAIEFTNLITEKTEYLEMSSDARLVVCGIFYGREEEGAPLIAKFTRDKHNRTKCTIDIASGVDVLFMVGLAAFFSDRVQFKSKRKTVKTERSISDKNKSITDNNNYYYYWLDTVSIGSISDSDVDFDIDADDYNNCGYEYYAHCDTAAFDVYSDGYHDGYGGYGGHGDHSGWGGDHGGWGGDHGGWGGDCGGGDGGGGGGGD